jgi:methionyl-tRNA formyltransferase
MIITLGDKLLKIIIIGQSDFGASTVERLIKNRNNSVLAVFTPPPTKTGQEDPMVKVSKINNVKIFQFPKLNSKEATKTFQNLKADLCVMAYVTDIVPEEIIFFPKFGTIQYHPSLLPKHRGPSSINWAIINGESKTGLTIFWPDKGLDTGPILLQKEVQIGANDTVGTLYFNKLFPLGIDAIKESVDLIRSGLYPMKNQDEHVATYESWCKKEDVQINWNKNVNDLHNLIRGSDPQPGAHTTLKSQSISIFGSHKLIGTQNEIPGLVLSLDKTGIRIACLGGSILFEKVRQKNDRKISAFEWSKSVKLKINDVAGR